MHIQSCGAEVQFKVTSVWCICFCVCTFVYGCVGFSTQFQSICSHNQSHNNSCSWSSHKPAVCCSSQCRPAQTGLHWLYLSWLEAGWGDLQVYEVEEGYYVTLINFKFHFVILILDLEIKWESAELIICWHLIIAVIPLTKPDKMIKWNSRCFLAM